MIEMGVLNFVDDLKRLKLFFEIVFKFFHHGFFQVKLFFKLSSVNNWVHVLIDLLSLEISQRILELKVLAKINFAHGLQKWFCGSLIQPELGLVFEGQGWDSNYLLWIQNVNIEVLLIDWFHIQVYFVLRAHNRVTHVLEIWIFKDFERLRPLLLCLEFVLIGWVHVVNQI